jgi:hypothetical protein
MTSRTQVRIDEGVLELINLKAAEMCFLFGDKQSENVSLAYTFAAHLSQCERPTGMERLNTWVRVSGARFRQKFTLEDAIGSHAWSLEANMRVTNGVPLGSSLLLPVCTVNCVQTRKATAGHLSNQHGRYSIRL